MATITVERWNGGTVERWSGGAVERWSGGAACLPIWRCITGPLFRLRAFHRSTVPPFHRANDLANTRLIGVAARVDLAHTGSLDDLARVVAAHLAARHDDDATRCAI